jgi:8-oxo-dGTP diphosphatase
VKELEEKMYDDIVLERMVLGFLFNSEGNQVILIKKNSPKWQQGRWNGVGGHVEKGELPKTAMLREGLEEIDADVEWIYFANITGRTWVVNIFYAIDDMAFVNAVAKTDEEIGRFDVSTLTEKAIPNLRWIIPMILNGAVPRGEIYYPYLAENGISKSIPNTAKKAAETIARIKSNWMKELIFSKTPTWLPYFFRRNLSQVIADAISAAIFTREPDTPMMSYESQAEAYAEGW